MSLGIMKKLFLNVSLGLMFCNIALTQSLLPECEGSDSKISEFSIKHFRQMRKWTNCQGTGIGPRGEKYVGEFYKGKFHGQGTFTKAGRKFIGEWQEGKKHGQGTYTYANGDKYVGEWIKNKYGEKGTYIYANGDKYVGDWKKVKYHVPDNQHERSGMGIYIYANGDKYVGEWQDGKRHGNGIFTYSDGKIEKGIWRKNKLVRLK